MWRRAWTEGGYVVVRCALEELEKYDIPDLELDLDNANKKYRDYLTELAQVGERGVLKQHHERASG
jgi:hypothetical protein